MALQILPPHARHRLVINRLRARVHMYARSLFYLFLKAMKRVLQYACILLTVFALTACGQKAAAPELGTTVRDTINGVPCVVYLPVHYAERTDVFPVLYLQHGMWGNENDWTEQGRLLPIMDSLLHVGQVKEMVVVMPDNCPSRPTSEEEKANATSGEWEGQFATFMAEAESRYRIASEPELRAIAGLSMGGYHTMQVSYVLAGQFAYVGMFSAATFVHHAPEQYRLFWIGIGKDDFLFDSLQDYRRWLEANHIEYTYYESEGGHTWPNWQDYITRFLPKLFL